MPGLRGEGGVMAREVWVIESRCERLDVDWGCRSFLPTRDAANVALSNLNATLSSFHWERRIVRYVPEDEK